MKPRSGFAWLIAFLLLGVFPGAAWPEEGAPETRAAEAAPAQADDAIEGTTDSEVTTRGGKLPPYPNLPAGSKMPPPTKLPPPPKPLAPAAVPAPAPSPEPTAVPVRRPLPKPPVATGDASAPAPAPSPEPSAVPVRRPLPKPPLATGDASPAPPPSLAPDPTERLPAPPVRSGLPSPSLRRQPSTPEIGESSAPTPGVRQLRRANAQRKLGSASPDESTELSPDSPRPPASPRIRKRDLGSATPIDDAADIAIGNVVRDTPHNESNTSRKLLVVHKLKGGAYGDIFVTEDEYGDPSIVKVARPLPDQSVKLGDPSYESYGLRMREIRKKDPTAKDLTKAELLEKAVTREVEMQTAASRALKRRGNDEWVDDAFAIGPNRIKQRYAGANFGDILDSVAKDGNLNPGQKEALVRGLLKQVLLAAEALDSAGIVHRDLHLGNVAMDGTGKVRVIDFGLAKRAAESDVELEISDGIGAGGVPSPELRKARREVDKTFKSSHLDDVYTIGDVFQREVDPSATTGKTVLDGSPKLKALLRDMTAATPATRLTASKALERLAEIESAEGDPNQDAAAVLAQKARDRIAATLGSPAPSASSNSASASSQ